tara:strand:- start:124 stop:312 length:189 start_codon:yes stop_codon:yes gene_type:complete
MKKIIFIMFLLTSCSFNNDSAFWTQDSKYAFKNLEYDKDYSLEEYERILNQYNKQNSYPKLD